MTDRYIEYMPIDAIPRANRNPKGHAAKVIRASIKRHGFVEAITIDERTGRLVAGHGRLDDLEVAHADGTEPPEGVRVDETGRWLAPVQRGWASANDAEAEAYLLTSNQASIAGGWIDVELAPVIVELQDGPGLDGVGFSDADIEAIFAGATPDAPPPATPEPEPRDAPRRVENGEIWQLGPHRIMCGDCRDAGHVDALMGDLVAHLAVTSPPYAEQREYDTTSGFRPIPPDEYVAWFDAVQANVARRLADDGSWLVNIKPSAQALDTNLYVMDLVVAHVRQWGWHFATEFCWERNGVPKQPVQRLKNQFEPVYQFAKDRWKFRPENVRYPSDNVPISLGAGSGDTSWARRQGHDGVIPKNRRPRKRGTARLMSDVQGTAFDTGEALVEGLAYPGNRLPTFVGTHQATGHTAAFPVGLPEFFVRLMTDAGDVVFDPFLGSGSTIIAAHNAGRVGLGMEISPVYCDIVVDRWERHTGMEAKRVAPSTPAETMNA